MDNLPSQYNTQSNQETNNQAEPNNSGASSTANSADKPRKGGLGKAIALFLVVLLVAALASGGTYLAMDKTAKQNAAELNSRIAALESPEYSLPEGAFKVSDCIPSMGYHYTTKDADPQYGPIYMVNKAGKVIGIEYMAANDMYTPIPNTNPPISVITKPGPVYGWKIDHATVSRLPQGHPGLEKDHIDVHLYTVSPEDVKNACN